MVYSMISQRATEQPGPKLWLASALRPELTCLVCDPAWQWIKPGEPLGEHYQQVWVDGVLEQLTPAAGYCLLGQLRNGICADIWVINQDLRWQFTQFIALGFRQDTQPDTQVVQPAQLYHYQLDNYNRTRSWNNAKFWANPQNFNRYRW